MKLVRFTTHAHPDGICGVVTAKGIEILRGSMLRPEEATGEVLSPDDIERYLPPVDPPNVLAIGRNYAEHAQEANMELPTKPLLFIMATTAANAHEQPVALPAAAPSQVDFEAELVAIIGKTARNVPAEHALEYVFGFTCGNDVSARDAQMGDGQWARGKSFDGFAPMGPYVVTDLDPTNLHIQMRLNGQTMQDSSTSQMIFSVADLVSYLSHSITLLPGTVIFTGTPSGVGFARKPPVFLKPGDVCEVEIEGIGTLTNNIVSG